MMRAAGGCARFPALARWSPPPPWLPSATELLFAGDATSRPGWAWCQSSTRPGAKQKLLGITKRGNSYLRTHAVHGARAVLLRVKYDTGGFGQWVHRLAQRAPRNKVDRGDRQQAGSHGLGRAVQRQRVSTPAAAAGAPDLAVEKTLRLESTKRFPLFHRHDDDSLQNDFYRGLLRTRRRRQNSRTACRKT